MQRIVGPREVVVDTRLLISCSPQDPVAERPWEFESPLSHDSEGAAIQVLRIPTASVNRSSDRSSWGRN